MELFSITKTTKQNEYQKAYSMIYAFTDDKKLQDKLFEYLDFRVSDCKNKGYRFYSSSIKSFLDSINTQMKNASIDEIWDAINLTLSYPSIRLLVPYKNSTTKNNIHSIEGFTSPDINTDGLNHNKSEREF